MAITVGQNALIRRIMQMPDPPGLAYPGARGVGLPRYVIQAAGGAQRTADLEGMTDSEPEIAVRVETVSDQPTTQSDNLVERLVELFRPGARFEGVSIRSAPSVRAPLTEGGIRSVPVMIRGEYQF